MTLEAESVVSQQAIFGTRNRTTPTEARSGHAGWLGGHVLHRASVDDGVKPYVSAQRGSNKH